MTTKLGMQNDLAALSSQEETPPDQGSRYKPRRQVSHEDGPDAAFWSTSYFIPGISGRARCLEDVNQTRGVVLEKPTTRRRSSNNSKSQVTSVVSRSSLERSWCAPKALVRGVNSSKKKKITFQNDKEEDSSWQGNDVVAVAIYFDGFFQRQ